MREFFGGWRRKAGCGVLVLACALMGGWIQSRTIENALRFTAFGRRNLVRSERSQIVWWAWDANDGDVRCPIWSSRPLWTPPNIEVAPGFIDGSPLQRLPHMDYLQARLFSRDDSRFGEWKIAYWTAVLPLIYLSAYLILCKPRPKVERDA